MQPWKQATFIGLLSIVACLLIGYRFKNEETLKDALDPFLDCHHVPEIGDICGEQLHITSVLVDGSRVRIVQADNSLGYVYRSKDHDHSDKLKHVIAEDTARADMTLALKAVDEHAKMVEARKGKFIQGVGVKTKNEVMKSKATRNMSTLVGGVVNESEPVGAETLFKQDEGILPNWHVGD